VSDPVGRALVLLAHGINDAELGLGTTLTGADDRATCRRLLAKVAEVVDVLDGATVEPTATAKQITAISAWIDHSPAYAGLDREAHDWRRIQKMVQEAGEVFEAFCGTFGENPRKGVTHTMADVERELYDVALSALGAVEHLNNNNGEAFEGFLKHVKSVCDRALASMEGQ
jgi:hypothetical protein